jgi:hypothetical protein
MLGDHFRASFFKFGEEMKHKMINCQTWANLSFHSDFCFISMFAYVKFYLLTNIKYKKNKKKVLMRG